MNTAQITAPITVALVDDQELIRTGFGLILGSAGDIEVVAEAADGAEALERIGALAAVGEAPDVVLMDVRMTGMDGIEATRLIAERYPSVRVLVLTTFDLDEYALAAIAAGASGFLLKDARAAELVAAVRAVAAGDSAMAPSVTRRLLMRLRSGDAPGQRAQASAASQAVGTQALQAPEAAQAAQAPQAPQTGQEAQLGGLRDPRLEALTERELEVFGLIAEGLSNAEIGERLFLSESTVKTHVGRVLAKLALRDRVHAVILAFEVGLR